VHFNEDFGHVAFVTAYVLFGIFSPSMIFLLTAFILGQCIRAAFPGALLVLTHGTTPKTVIGPFKSH
jgi:hypothetical protein